MELNRSALRDWFGTFGTNVFLLLIGIGTGILAARSLGPVGRGQFAETLFWGNFVAQLGAFGLSSIVTLESARYGPGQKLTSTVILLSAIYSIVSVSVFMVMVAGLSISQDKASIAFVAIYVPINILGLSLLSIDAGAQRFAFLNSMRLIPQCVYAIVIVCLTAYGLASSASFAWAMLLGSALVPVARLIMERQEVCRLPDALRARRLFVGGIQFYITSLIGIVREASDRLVVLAALDQIALGLYAVALTIAGSAIQNVAGATVTILLPKALATADVHARGRQLASASSASLFVCAIVNGTLAIVSPVVIPILFGGDFRAAVPVAVALCLAQTARSGAEILSQGLRGLDDWKAMPITAGVALFVFVPLGFTLAPILGITGVAIAVAVGNLASFIFVLMRTVRKTGLSVISFIVPPKWIFSPASIRYRLKAR